MGKYIIITLCFLANFTVSNAQGIDYDKLENYVTNNDKIENRLEFLLQNQFSQLINTNTQGMIGDFVGLSTNDKALSFAYNFARDDRSYEIDFSGDINDGIAGIITNRKFKSSVKLGFKYHQLIGAQEIGIIYDDIQAIREEVQRLNSEIYFLGLKDKGVENELKKSVVEKKDLVIALKRKKAVMVLAKPKKAILDKEKAKYLDHQEKILEAEVRLFESKIGNIGATITNLLTALRKKRKTISEYQFNADSLKILELPFLLKDSLKVRKKNLVEIKKKIKANTFSQEKLDEVERQLKIAESELKVAEKKYKNHKNGWAFGKNYNALVSKKRKALEKLFSVRVKDFKLGWISLGGRIASESYSLFDPRLPHNEQVRQETDLIPSLNASYSFYSNRKSLSRSDLDRRRVCFFTLGGIYRSGNNFSTLSEVTLESVDTISADQYVVNSRKVFIGTFEDRINSGQLFVDYYELGYTTGNLGFHLRATLDIGPHSPIYSARAGILFSAVDMKDFNSIVNFEIFFGLNDIFKKDEEDEILSRNILGLQTTFPF